MITKSRSPWYALLFVFLSTGCTFRSPILIYKTQAVSNPNRIPLKIGVNRPEFKQERHLVNVSVRPIGFLFLQCYQMGFPKPDEKEMLADYFVQYVRDTNLFEYAYIYPFDVRDVDLVVDLKVTRFHAGQDKFIPHLVSLPYINFVLLAGFPQELFHSEIDMTFDISSPDGKKISTYSTKTEDSDAVTIYEQPYGKYAWENSVFKKEYFKVLDGFALKVVEDRQALIEANKDFRQRQF